MTYYVSSGTLTPSAPDVPIAAVRTVQHHTGLTHYF